MYSRALDSEKCQDYIASFKIGPLILEILRIAKIIKR